MPLPRAATAVLVLLAASACPSLIVAWAAAQVEATPAPGPTASSGVGGEPRDGVGTVPQPVKPPKTTAPQTARTQAPATTVPPSSSTGAGSPSSEPTATQPPATATKPVVPTITVTVPPLITQPPAKDPEPAGSDEGNPGG